MSPNDRYQVCGMIAGLICTASTKAEAFRLGEKAAFAEDDDGWDRGANDCPIEVFDCFAHIGKPELWRYDDDSNTWNVVVVRG